MKQLFIYTSSLLRTVLLLGAIVIVNTQQTKAQPVSITAEMPDAFETIKNPVAGEYYYIQFYKEEVYSPYLYQSFMGELGEGQQMQAMDYMPFAANRLWMLVAGSDATHFKLKSKRGFYAYYDNNNRFRTTATAENASEFTITDRNGYRTGFKELMSGSARLGRYSKDEWGGIINTQGYNNVNFVRFAKLKPNAAHIIYYRGEHADGLDNDRVSANAATTRHYLTYSDADSEITASVILNGNLEANLGGGDASCFYIGEPSSTTPRQATITNGIGVDGSKGISVTSGATDDPQEWDTQFFIRAKDVIPAGKTIHVEFDYKASAAVNEVHTQAHAEPGVYRGYGTFGTLNFTTQWQHYSRDVEVTGTMGNDFRTIALDLYKNNAGVVYYFDNIVFTAPTTSKVSSRRSIIPSDKSLWTLPTAAVYHQDGLWILEEASNDGQFYIKRYGEEQYLTVRQINDYNYCTVLGDKEDLYGKFELETPTANRYTRIHNVCPLWGLGRYLSFWGGDGSPVMQGPYYDDSWWNAGFYPVEVPVSGKDEFFQVRVKLNPPNGTQEERQYIPLNPKQNDGTTRLSILRQEGDNIIGATYKAKDNYKNCFQYTGDNALTVSSGYQKIVVRFASPVEGNWGISGIVPNGSGGWTQGWEQIPVGSMYYEMDLTGITVINDFTIFSTTNSNYDDTNHPVKIEIAEIYFYKGSMLNNATGASMSSSEGFPSLWELEQVEDYDHFRLKNPNTGKYLAGNGRMTEPNDPYGEVGADEAETNSNSKFWTDFTLKWYLPTEDAEKEIIVNYYVTHKESYLRAYADKQVIADQDGLKKQGLSRDIDSDWWNFDGNGFDPKKGTQKTNHFEITHYIKKGNSKVIEFPTVLNRNNDHIFFQRFYHYTEPDTEMDLDKLKAHVSLDTRDDGDVQYFLYKNGMVTGQKLDWTYDDGTAIPDDGMARNEQRRFNFTNSDGQPFTVAVDVSRYSDLEYVNKTSHLSGDLIEPSLTMRYIFNMNDAKDMAKSLTDCPEGGSKWLESKEIHFGRTQVPYTKFKKVGYRGEFIGLRHVFSDYWVYDNPNLITKDANGKVVVNTSYISNNFNVDTANEDALNDFLDQHLVSAVNNNNGGKIEVEIDDPNHTGIRRGGYNALLESTLDNGLKNQDYDDSNDDESNYQGFYFYDKLSPSPKTEYGNSRFVVFRYPAGSIVNNYGPNNKAYVKVYFRVDENTRYQLAQYTLIFDANMATRPWTEIKNGTGYANGVNKVKGTDRDPRSLRAKAGHPIAKISFDYPINTTYHYPSEYESNSTDGITKHNGGNNNPGGTIANSSPIPLTFGHTNYAFDGDWCNWGSYAMVTTMETHFGNVKTILPADDADYGYNLPADDGMQKAFLYIDASEQPGDICAVEFEGEFCADDKLMCTGWISGSNKIQNDDRCPGSITLTVKGEDENGNSNTIYRFCPGQIYELNNGYGADVNGNATAAENAAGIDGNGNNATHVVWQQFYFEFSTDRKYERYWLEVNNNCVSSNGGDFMIDNVEVYTIVPEVEPEINTPLCISVDETGKEVTEMRLLKLRINHNKLVSSRTVGSDGTAEEGFVFLEKYKFLETFKTGLAKLTSQEKHALGLDRFDFANITLDALADSIDKGALSSINMSSLEETDKAYIAYKDAFDSAILGKKSTWHSDDRDNVNTMNSSILYFRWSSTFENNTYQPPYSFADAVNKKHAVYREVEVVEGEKINYIVMNGNYPGLNWKTNVDYYVINTNQTFASGKPFTAFNLCSECCKASTFKIDPPYHVLGLESSETTDDYVVCEGQIPTIVLNLKGFDLNGNEVDMSGINYDWWLGDPTYTETDDDNNVIRPKLATLEHYHAQHKVINGVDVKLDKALSTFRTYYPSATSLEGLRHEVQHAPDPALTINMIDYLQELIDADELVLHQTSVSVPAEPVASDDSYFYMVACPIHDEMFDQALNPEENEYVSYYCDEPQGLRIKVGGKSPRLQTGFVPGEHGFQTYNYNFPANTNPVLSIRLAKAAQFETVKNTVEEVKVTNAETNEVTYTISEAPNYLWLPIRNAQTEGATGVIKKAKDDNVYLASSNDLTWDKKISAEMNKNGSLPIVGRIVQLTAVNTKNNSNADENGNNRLCVYFVKDFNVREGYNYTLSLPFQEDDNSNACDGTILINLKIVPDYEVWTGAAANPSDPTASNTDWNNDENWRRADGNTTINNSYYGDELYRANGAVDNEDSPLHTYTTNKDNYYSSSKKANAKPSSDQILRKGFAPLYCTHVLMKSDEWGNAPVLYDALDYKVEDTEHKLNDAPFPNLRETSTPILKFDMQARRWDMWNETYGENPDRGSSSRPNDLIAEMYQINSCDEIVFQPGTELRNAHLLNYNSAWMEYQLDNKRWYLLGSPLQGTISGEWYAPTGTAQQKTTYYDPVTFGTGYDRYSPAIYQRSWDKSKTVLYEIGSEYSTTDDSQTENLGYAWGGHWDGSNWKDPSEATDGTGADEYLDRLGYKPMGGNKANVAIKGIWSNTYNDAQVDYADGGFSVMVMNHLKGNDTSGDKAIIRLPKEDTKYFYFEYSEDGSRDDTNNTGDTKTDLSDVRTKDRAKNRGRLKADKLLPATVRVDNNDVEIRKTETAVSIYGDARNYTRIPIREDALQEMNNSFLPIVVDGNPQPPTAGLFTETVAAGISHLNYYLVENPFPCGLDMDKFFEANPGLEKKYWLLTASGQHLVQKGEENDEWISPTISTSDGDVFASANSILAPGQGFFVEATAPAEPVTSIAITFNKDMQTQSRFGVKDNENGMTFTIVVGQAQEMEPLKEKYDSNENGVIDEDDEERIVTIRVDTDGDGILDADETVMVPKYIDDPDNPGTKIPSLSDIEEDVVIYKYKQESLDATHNKEYPLLGRTRGEETEPSLQGLVITAQRDDNQSSALVMQRDEASNDFLPSEDTETFITSDLEHVPTVYTLCGRLATTINSIHDFRSLPIGVESNSDAPCTLTFKGVEMLGDSIAFYDALEQKLTPLKSGMTVSVSGQTQNRYYLVRSLIKEEAAAETHLQIFTEGLTAKVIASTGEPITSVRCYDTAGRLIHSASPQTPEYSFSLPIAGIYIISAETENDRKTIKLMAK